MTFSFYSKLTRPLNPHGTVFTVAKFTTVILMTYWSLSQLHNPEHVHISLTVLRTVTAQMSLTGVYLPFASINKPTCVHTHCLLVAYCWERAVSTANCSISNPACIAVAVLSPHRWQPSRSQFPYTPTLRLFIFANTINHILSNSNCIYLAVLWALCTSCYVITRVVVNRQ